jgi:heat shock protein HslJ
MNMARVGSWLALASLAAWMATGCSSRDQELRRLDGRHFIAESVSGKDLVPGTEIRLSFDDGQVSLNAGCNSMSGPYRLEDGALHVDGFGMTAIGCDAPRHAQDDWLAQLLSDRPELELDEPRLTLRSSDVTVVFLDREMASPDRPLVGTRWIGNGIGDGSAVSFGSGSETITVSFGADGEFEVFTGCVNGAGTYSASETEISFEAIGYDDEVCSDPRLSGLSVQVMQVLDGSTLEYELEERNLELHHASGRALFFRADD